MVVFVMNPERLQARVAPTGRLGVRLNTLQRDLFVRSAETPRDLVYALRNAPVRDGKLSVRVRRAELDALISAAAAAPAATRREERELAALVRYLEGMADRFLEPPEDGEDVDGHGDDLRRAGMSEE